jgi:hypothetical protein
MSKHKTWKRALEDGAVSGSVASLVSTVALAARGRTENGSAAAPTNAISHWLWGDRAYRKNRPTARHTAVGYVIHHAASIFWGVLYERFHSRPMRDAALASALACFVDYRLTPRRLTPGFEQRLSKRSLLLVYAAFALGLSAGTRLTRRAHPDRSSSRRGY